MKASEIFEKCKAFFKKAGKKTIITVCTVLVLGCAVVLNVILFSNGKQTDDKGSDFAVDLASTDKDGQNKTASNDAGNYFASMSLSRQQARDEAMEVLKAVAESSTALDEAKQAAIGDISKLASDIEKESNIETLILSKGFEQCIAVINNDSCNVIVQTNGLLPTEVAQISEIVYEQAGIIPTNLTIIEKSNVEM